jgi:murein DD-endopeptidase MepM/ murein hydrolase activator NlpD
MQPEKAGVETVSAWTYPLARWRLSRGWKPGHKGADLAVATGNTVFAVASGRAQKLWSVHGTTKADKLNGNAVRFIHDDGTGAGYAHMQELWVRPGQQVQQGEAIGLSGNTGHSSGPHLHLTAFDRSGQRVDPGHYLAGLYDPSRARSGLLWLGAAALVLLPLAFSTQRKTA